MSNPTSKKKETCLQQLHESGSGSADYIPCLLCCCRALGYNDIRLDGVAGGYRYNREGREQNAEGLHYALMLYTPGDETDGVQLHICIGIVPLFLERKDFVSQSLLGVLQFYRLLCCPVGCAYIGFSCRSQLGIYNLCHSLHKVARLLGLLRDFCCRDTQVIEDQRRFTAETGHDAVGHVVYRLACLLRLQLSKLQILAQIFQRNAEVLSLYGSRHQLNVIHGPLSCLAEIIQQSLLVQTVECPGYTICLLCHLKTAINELSDGVLKFSHFFAEELCTFG